MSSIQLILQVVELREVLDGEIAALASKRRTKSQLLAIHQAQAQIENSIDENLSIDADVIFHRRIADATGNPQLIDLSEYLIGFLNKAAQTTSSSGGLCETPAHVKKEHRAIVAAVSRQNSAAARAAAHVHTGTLYRHFGRIR